MRLGDLERKEGQRMPPWWYGFSHCLWLEQIAVYRPIPLNYVERWTRLLVQRWDAWRARPSRFDDLVEQVEARAYDRGYQAGRRAVEQEARGLTLAVDDDGRLVRRVGT